MEFKHWLLSEEFMTKSLVLTQLKTGIQNIEKAKDFILNMLDLGQTNEHYWPWELAQEVEDDVLNHELFLNRISKYGIKPLGEPPPYSKSCGKDSCAYFFTKNYVIKFLGGSKPYKEFKIAESVQGRLGVVPIVEAFSLELPEKDSIEYVVVMKKLNDDFFAISESVKYAASLVSSIMYNLQVLVEKKPDIPIDYIRRRLSLAYMIRNENVSEEVKMAIKDLVRVIRLVYDKSGYLFGADFEHGRNVGISPKGKVMTFDYGRPDLHKKKAEDLEG